jgi:carboxypeptidase T
MELIVKVTSTGLRTPLADLLRLPLGLDVWEVKPDHLILRAAEPQIDRLARMGYGVEQMQDVETHLRAFATAEAVSGYHSAASLEQELRQLADARPDIAELREIGRSIEGRAIYVLRIGERNGGQTPKILFMGCHHAREWIAVGTLPLGQGTGRAGRRSPDCGLAVQGRDLGGAHGQPGRP